MLGNTKKAYLMLFWICAAFGVFFLFSGSFSSYFFQDDWFSLQISNVSTIGGVLRFFIPRNDVIYYRPLGMQLVFFIFQKLFGSIPLPFRLATIIIHMSNGYLVGRLLSKFFKNKAISYFGILLYLTAAIHFTVFFWAATIAFVMAPFFYFSAFLFFLENKKKISLALFIFGLLTNELLISFPAVIFLWSMMQRKKQLKNTQWFWFIVFCYIGTRFVLFKPPTTGSYAVAYAPLQILLNFRDYVLWTFNFPEEIHNQFINWFVFNPVFVKEFFPAIASFCVALIAFFVLIITGVISSIGTKLKIAKVQTVAFGSIWFVVTLAPVLFFSSHAFSYYLAIPFLGLLIALFSLIKELIKTHSKIIYGALLIFCIAWVVSSYQSIQFNIFIHWAPRRAEIAYKTLQELQHQNPNPHDNDVFHVPAGDEYHWALSDQHGVQVFFNNPTLKTVYDK